MLTMTNPLLIEGYTVYRDDADEMARLSSPGSPTTGSAARFFVLPDTPAIAVDSAGVPIFSLVVYRHDEDRIDPAASGEDVGGGILTFTVELTVPDDKMKKIRTKLRTMVWGDDADDPNKDVEVSLVQFLDGRVSVAVAGETTAGEDNEFVKGAVGTGTIAGVGGGRKAVMVKLTQAGASLMAQLDTLRTLPINVQYELSFEHRLVGVTMRVWCNVESSYELFQQVFHDTDEYSDGYLSLSSNHVSIDKITQVTETLVREKTAGVTVVPQTSSIDQETLLALEKFGFDLLNKELEKVVEASPPPAELDRSYLGHLVTEGPAYSSTATNNFNFSLDRTVVLVQNFTPSANVSNVFQRADFDSLVAFVDLRNAFFSFLKIPIRVNADFEAMPIDSVTVTVRYQRQRFGGGGREEVVDSFDFRDGSTINTFLAFANSLADVRYDWWAEVHYKGSPQTFVLNRNQVTDEFLVVDVGQLGILSVKLGLGLVDTEKYPAAKVTLRYASDALGRTVEQEVLLNDDATNAVWNEVIREVPAKGYDYKIDWLRKDGDILTGDWTHSNASVLRFDAPVGDKLDVTVLCSGNFTDPVDKIAQVAVALRYEDPDNAYTEEGHLVFTSDAQQQPWLVDLRNPQLRDYRYKYSIIYVGGLVKEFPADGTWFDGQPGFITVGEKYTLAVDLYPTLQAWADRAKLVQVDLTYTDANTNTHQADSFVFSATANTVRTWRVRGNPEGAKNWTYRISYFGVDGTVITTDPVTREGESLVIPPLPAPIAPTPPPPPVTPPTPTPPPPPVTPPTPTPPVVVTPIPTPTPPTPTPTPPPGPGPIIVTPTPPTPVVATPVTPVTPTPVTPTPVTPTPVTPTPTPVPPPGPGR